MHYYKIEVVIKRKIITTVVSLLVLISIQIPSYSQMDISPFKVVMIIAHQGFQDDEFLRPKEVLQRNGIEIKIASSSLTESTSMRGIKVKPDILLSDIDVYDFDAIVFVGGSGAVQYLDDPIAHKVAVDAVNAERIVAAICIGPMILAKAGVLKGKDATVWSSEGVKLQSLGGNYTANSVEIDGNIITASGPPAAEEFGEEILKALNNR